MKKTRIPEDRRQCDQSHDDSFDLRRPFGRENSQRRCGDHLGVCRFHGRQPGVSGSRRRTDGGYLAEMYRVSSANDACVAMAEYISGTEEAFVQQMNERARGLGMENTVFKNCNGWIRTVM